MLREPMRAEPTLKHPPAQGGGSFANALRANLASAIVFVSAEDETLSFSPEAGRMLGLVDDGARLTAVCLPGALLGLARQGLAGCAVAARQMELKPGGRELSVDVSVVPLLAQGRREGALLVLNDVAAAKSFEADLHQINRLANLGSLAAGMAHEIKNALVAGKTLVDLLLEKNHEPEMADVVRREIGRIDGIVGRMLKLAAPGCAPGTLNPVQLHEAVEYTLRLVGPELHTRKIELERSFEASSDLISGERERLQQAIINLLLNSVEALPCGGNISVRTDNGEELSHKGGHQPEWVRLSIADTGTGISAEHLPHVFEPFFTTKASGTGLGLAITQQIICEHGGSIIAQSEPGRGTRFELMFPLLPNAEPLSDQRLSR